jgi:hypothetical protein
VITALQQRTRQEISGGAARLLARLHKPQKRQVSQLLVWRSAGQIFGRAATTVVACQSLKARLTDTPTAAPSPQLLL